MVVLAEGVESNEHFSILKVCGCDLMQGYYCPIPYDELCEYLTPTQVEKEDNHSEPTV